MDQDILIKKHSYGIVSNLLIIILEIMHGLAFWRSSNELIPFSIFLLCRYHIDLIKHWLRYTNVFLLWSFFDLRVEKLLYKKFDDDLITKCLILQSLWSLNKRKRKIHHETKIFKSCKWYNHFKVILKISLDWSRQVFLKIKCNRAFLTFITWPSQ